LGGNIWPAANGPKTKGRAQLLALQVAQKLCAGKAKGVERTVFREAVIKAFTDSGVLSASSASPTISDMIKAGVIVYELRA
jgi:hypothetical protein